MSIKVLYIGKKSTNVSPSTGNWSWNLIVFNSFHWPLDHTLECTFNTALRQTAPPPNRHSPTPPQVKTHLQKSASLCLSYFCSHICDAKGDRYREFIQPNPTNLGLTYSWLDDILAMAYTRGSRPITETNDNYYVVFIQANCSPLAFCYISNRAMIKKLVKQGIGENNTYTNKKCVEESGYNLWQLQFIESQ